jgi:hypothetical protein
MHPSCGRCYTRNFIKRDVPLFILFPRPRLLPSKLSSICNPSRPRSPQPHLFKSITARTTPTDTHNRHAPRRNVRPRETRRHMPRKEPLDILRHVESCELSWWGGQPRECAGYFLRGCVVMYWTWFLKLYISIQFNTDRGPLHLRYSGLGV